MLDAGIFKAHGRNFLLSHGETLLLYLWSCLSIPILFHDLHIVANAPAASARLSEVQLAQSAVF